MTLSRPVYAHDLPLSCLKTGEALITVTLRLLAGQWRESGDDYPNWRQGLQASGLSPWAIAAFESLFEIVVAARRHPLDVRDLHCPRLGSDERRFIEIISLFQHGRSEQAEGILRGWLPAAAFRLAAYPAASLASALQQADLLIPLRGVVASVNGHQLSANRSWMWMQ